ncbi:MAG: type II toxin-antitoxin system RelE family toxin [Candidatus Binataceae bacterium]
MNWNVLLTGPARKQLAALDAKDYRLIVKALKAMEGDPRGGDVLKLEGALGGFRGRAGNWRIFFDLYPEQLQVVVSAIVRRTTTTYRNRG